MAFQVCVRKRGAGWTVAYQSTVLDANFDLAWGDALKDWSNTDVILRDTNGATFATRYAFPVFARTGSVERMRTFELLLLASAFTTGLMMKRGEGMWLSVFGGVGVALLLDQLLSTKGDVTFESPVGVNVASLQGA